MTAFAARLLPDSASVDGDGALSIGGVPVADLAAQWGTPLFVYDESHLRARCREAVSAFGRDAVIYATKAFLCGQMARLAHEEGLLLDVATGGELHTVLAAGVPGSACVLHGNNKSDGELRAALAAGVRHIVVDSFDELERIEVIHRETGLIARVQLRVTPGVHVHTHEYVSTGQDDSKFGFNLGNGDALRAVDTARASSAVELVGIHCHIGSNVFAVENFADASRVMVDFFAGLGLAELTLGGGLGVAYTAAEEAPSIAQWADVLQRATAQLGDGVRVMVEPGRAIVAQSAVTVYTVGTVKHIDGVRTYVAVDGGMSDNPRPVLYGSGYEAFDPRRTNDVRAGRARVVGKHCESGDVIIDDAEVPVDLAVGDLLVTPVTGAYGYSMANNYNKVPRPAVVFVAGGQSRLVVRRETLDDLVRLDVL